MKKYLYMFVIGVLACMTSCDKEVVPVLTAVTVDDATESTITCHCEALEGTVEACGFYYTTSKNNLKNKKADKATGTLTGSTFSSEITKLKPNTTYYIMGYAMNEKGEGVTEVLQVKTTSLLPGEDDNQYPGITD